MTLLGDRVFTEVIKKLVIKRGNLDTDKQREEDVKRQREKVVSDTRRREAWNRSFPRGPQKESPCRYPNLSLLDSRTMRQYIYVV